MKELKPSKRQRKVRGPRRVRVDGEATRARILEAAGRLLAANGYAGTSSKSVAIRAKVSLASINYYFGGRQGLYRAVLVEAHRRVVSLSDLRELAGSELSAAAKLRVLIDQLVQQATTQAGWHMDVLAREILAPSDHIQALVQAMPPKLAIIMRVLSEITEIPQGDPALARCHLSAFSACTLLLLMARGVPGPMHDIRQMPPAVLSDHLHTFALAGLETMGREYRGRRRVDPVRSESAAPNPPRAVDSVENLSEV